MATYEEGRFKVLRRLRCFDDVVAAEAARWVRLASYEERKWRKQQCVQAWRCGVVVVRQRVCREGVWRFAPLSVFLSIISDI